MKRILISLSFMLGVIQLMAQQDPTYGQYIFNSTILNPAQAGVQDNNQVGILTRKQWLGMDGAPTTNSIFANTRLQKNLGLAGGVYNDKIGPTNTVTVQADIATQVQLNESWTFSGGIRASVSNMRANLTTLAIGQIGDPNFNTNYNSGLYMNMGAGVLLYSEKYFFGASMPRLFNKQIKEGDAVLTNLQNHFFIYGGANMMVKEDITFTPSLLFKKVANSPLSVDVNFVFNYKDFLDLGPMIRYKDAFGFLVGYKISPQFYVGYMYEYPISDVQMISKQTHELSLRVNWQTKYKKKIKSPRYFL